MGEGDLPNNLQHSLPTSPLTFWANQRKVVNGDHVIKGHLVIDHKCKRVAMHPEYDHVTVEVLGGPVFS